MIPFLGFLALTGGAAIAWLLQIVGGFAMHDVPPWVRRAHLVALAALVAQPGLVALVALGGNQMAVLAMAGLPLMAVAALWGYVTIRVQYSYRQPPGPPPVGPGPHGRPGPLVVGTAIVGVAEILDRTRAATNALFRALGLYFLVDLIYGMWFAAMPFGANRGMVAWAFAFWVLTMLSFAVLGKRVRQLGHTLLVGVLAVALLALIVGIPYVLTRGDGNDARAAPTEVGRGQPDFTVTMLESGDLSTDVFNTDWVRLDRCYQWFGPEGTLVYWPDGRYGNLRVDWNGNESGEARFANPEGGKVSIWEVDC